MVKKEETYTRHTQNKPHNQWGGKIDVLHLASDITISLFTLFLSLSVYFLFFNGTDTKPFLSSR